MPRKTLFLRDPQQAHKVIIDVLWPYVKGWLGAGGSALMLEVKPETRSLAENALLHALLTHISKTKDWAGKKQSAETWKRLLTAAWCRARGEPVKILPALDGHGVDIVFRHTSKLSRKDCAELIEYIYAWGALEGVEFPPDPRYNQGQR